nr:unnamed protein product [Callosobruchus analis]
MSWHDHVATIAKTASQKLGVLFRCRKLYTPEQLLLLYKAQIRPSLEYCSQNRAVKLIDTHNLTKDLHSLEHRIRFYHGRCSSELSQIITPKAVRTRNTREALHAHPYQVEVGLHSSNKSPLAFFLLEDSTLWNEVPGSFFWILSSRENLRLIDASNLTKDLHSLERRRRVVIMATNRIETLDPALIRPGRIDRKIEFPLPDEKTKKRIFNIHTSRMTLAEDVNLQELIMAKDDLSGADIKAICTEAGLMALRERRMKVMNEDFRKSKENVLYRKKEGTPEGLYL